MKNALIKILHNASLTNEDGADLVSFENQGRDSLDFTSVSRTVLKQMLEAAYEAGQRSKKG